MIPTIPEMIGELYQHTKILGIMCAINYLLLAGLFVYVLLKKSKYLKIEK